MSSPLSLEQVIQELLSKKQDPLLDLFSNIFSKDSANLSSLFDILQLRKEDKASNSEEDLKSKTVITPTVEELLRYYAPLVCETFIHKTKRTKYVLIEIVNTNSTNQDKFPVSVIYYDKQLQTKWCRPLVEFHNNFKLVM